MIALVSFLRGSFGTLYSYVTDIENLEEGDLVLVEANDTYSLARFDHYTDKEKFKEQATKNIVSNLQPTIDEFEIKNILG